MQAMIVVLKFMKLNNFMKAKVKRREEKPKPRYSASYRG
jgi:hypothetical protein